MGDKMSWGDFAVSLYDKLTGRGAEITYHFENLEVFVPMDVGDKTDHCHWKVNGVLKIRTRDASAS